MFYNGVLVDSLSGQPIPGVSVSISTGADPVSVAMTAADGQFSFTQTDAVAELIFTKIGYYPVTRAANDIAQLPASIIEMEAGSAETLEPVIVQPSLKWILGAAAIGFIGYHAFKK